MFEDIITIIPIFFSLFQLVLIINEAGVAGSLCFYVFSMPVVYLVPILYLWQMLHV